MSLGAFRLVGCLRLLKQHVLRHCLLSRLGLFDDEIDDLVLDDGRAQLCERSGGLLVVLVYRLLLPWETPSLLDQDAAQLVLRDLDVVLLGDLANDEAEADAALRDAAILGAGLLLRLVLVGETTCPTGAWSR